MSEGDRPPLPALAADHGASGSGGDPFCAAVAKAQRAPLAGTASQAALFLLIEHRGAWGARAVEENDLPPVAARWLGGQLAALADTAKARVLFVRQEGEDRQGLRCFLADARDDRQALYAFAVEDASELAHLDLAGGLAAGALEAHLSGERLTLVCANGRRDRCCAREGRATYAALAESAPATTWLSTHQGGHRHAAVALWLPEGVAYGYLSPADAAPLHAARARGALHLPRFRGRCPHSALAQAADALLRAELGVEPLDAWRPQREERRQWGGQVRLEGPAGAYEVTIARREEEALVSCTPPKRQRIESFELVAWRREEP